MGSVGPVSWALVQVPPGVEPAPTGTTDMALQREKWFVCVLSRPAVSLMLPTSTSHSPVLVFRNA
eukprot:2640139-Rhodomonas_salina.1